MAQPRPDGPEGQGGWVTKSDRARQHIQEMIVSGRVRAGDRLTTRTVADALAMSETPVREAMRALAAEGWIALHAHAGCVVASTTGEHLAEIYALRASLGAVAVELGGPLYTKAQLAQLARNLQQAEAAVNARSPVRYARLNAEFHLLLADTPGTQWTHRLLTALQAQTVAMASGFHLIPDRAHRSLDEHIGIVAAIRAGAFAEAARLVATHERNAGAELIAAMGAG